MDIWDIVFILIVAVGVISVLVFSGSAIMSAVCIAKGKAMSKPATVITAVSGTVMAITVMVLLYFGYMFIFDCMVTPSDYSNVDAVYVEVTYIASLFLIIGVIAIFLLVFSAASVIVRKARKNGKTKPFIITGIVSAVVIPVSLILAAYFTTICVHRFLVEQIPNLTGFNYQEAKAYYADKFDLVVEQQLYSTEYPEGAIIDQSPTAGKDYIIGKSTVQCVVSKGVRMVTVSNVYGFDLETAKTILAYDMFDVVIEYEYSDEISEGYVISTNPEKFEKVPVGSEVTVVVSKGSPENNETQPIQN